jgi:multidrug efflux pump subunit AcrA (membrane-fusion protein)
MHLQALPYSRYSLQWCAIDAFEKRETAIKFLGIVACAAAAATLTFTLSISEIVPLGGCDLQAIEFEDIEKLLQRLSKESNLEEERRITRRALRSVTTLAEKTRKCGCEKLTAKLEAAEAGLRQAREAGSYRQISAHVDRAITDINASAALMETCSLK